MKTADKLPKMHRMKKKHKDILLAILGVILAIVVVRTVSKGKLITPDELDYLTAHRKSDGLITLIGGWEAPGGRYLTAAEHEIVDGQLVVYLYRMSTLTKRRVFRVTIDPGEQTISSISAAHPKGETTNLEIIDHTEPTDRSSPFYGIDMQSKQRQHSHEPGE